MLMHNHLSGRSGHQPESGWLPSGWMRGMKLWRLRSRRLVVPPAWGYGSRTAECWQEVEAHLSSITSPAGAREHVGVDPPTNNPFRRTGICVLLFFSN